MKKLALLLLASATAGSAIAQTVIKENRGLITKISATWCYPCGSWGWDLMNDVITTNEANAFPMSLFASSQDQGWANTDFYNSTNVTIANMLTFNGYPSYAANAKDVSLKNTNASTGNVNTAGIKSDLNAALAAFKTAPVVASAGMSYKITGNTIEVKTKTQFWAAATGTYNVAVYLLEDAAHIQNGQTGAVSHHGVLRASLSTAVWGEQLVAGSATANQTIDKTFTYTLSGDGLTKWDKTKFHPVVVIWKQNGSKWDYVNGTENYSYTTSVPNTPAMNSLAIYPNPATDVANISMVLDNAAPVTINVTDAMGRVVYNSGTLQFSAGKNEHRLNTASLASGVYNVVIRSNSDVLTQHISVTK